MRNRRSQFDVAHALTADFLQRNLNAALFADDAAILHALVLAAQTFVITDRPENTGAEQAIPLRLEGAVVDCLWLLDFAEGPGANTLGRRNRYAYLVERLRCA